VPEHWHGGIGNVIIANADGTPMSLATASALTDYVSDILNAFGDDEAPPTRTYDRPKLDAYIREHAKM